jgi:nucleoside-diphosphate-sugar epimerase
MILVVGGRSKIGSAVIDLLLRQGEEIRALVRDSEGPIAGGAESVVGDLADVRYR